MRLYLSPSALEPLPFPWRPSAAARPDLNAFLNRQGLEALQGLVAQVQNDPEVADRYERHFSMSKVEVVDYVGRPSPFDPLSQRWRCTPSTAFRPDGRLKMHVREVEERANRYSLTGLGQARSDRQVRQSRRPWDRARANRGNPVALVPTDRVRHPDPRRWTCLRRPWPWTRRATLVALAPRRARHPAGRPDRRPRCRPFVEPASADGPRDVGRGRRPLPLVRWALPLLIPI